MRGGLLVKNGAGWWKKGAVGVRVHLNNNNKLVTHVRIIVHAFVLNEGRLCTYSRKGNRTHVQIVHAFAAAECGEAEQHMETRMQDC